MPRPPTAERDKVRSETRQQLLQAAAAEFTREGYVGANINRISQAAGYAKGTIYNYFPSKRALMLALIDEIGSAHTAFIVQQVEAETDPVRRLERFFSAGFAFVEEHPTQAPVIISTLYGPDAEFRERVFEAYDGLFGLIIQGILGPGAAQGVFRTVDPDLAAALLMSVYLGSCSLLESDGKIWITPAQALDFVLAGLGQVHHSLAAGRESDAAQPE
jgi:AcrR family transcriptional regulator